MWHVKKKADCRLYSGSLSSEAQKILTALRAQRKHVSRVNTRHYQHDRLLGNGQYEGQWEPFCQSTPSQQEGNSQPSVTPPYTQSSQAQHWNLSSQVSSYSSSWDALCYNQTNQRESHDLFSHRGENISFQSSHYLSFPHCDELETDKSFPQTDPYTRPLKSSQSISGKVVAWKSAEEIPKSLPEGPNEMPFLKETKNWPDDPWGNEMNNSVIDKPNGTPSISQRDSSGRDGTTKRIRLNLALEYESKSGLCLAINKMSSKGLEFSEVSQVGEDEQVFSTDKKIEKKQTVLTGDRMPLLLPECYDAIKSSDTCAKNSSRNILLSIDTDGDTTGQALHTMNVEEEKEADGAVPHSDESKARQCKSIKNPDISPKDKKQKMSFINKTKSVTTQMAHSDPLCGIGGETSNSAAPVNSPGCKGTLPTFIKESAPEGNLFNLEVSCEVHSDAIPCSSFTAQSEGFGLLHSTLKQPHPQPLKHTLKRKYEAPHSLTENDNSSKSSSTRCPPKWKPPSSQENKRDNFRKSNSNQTDKVIEEKRTDEIKHGSISVDGPNHREVGKCMRSKPGNFTSSLTSDPRVTDASKLSQGDMDSIVKKAQQSVALVLTMVFRDGTTHLDPEQKRSPPACGLLLLIKTTKDTALETLGPKDILLYLKLECAPAWAQHPTPHIHEMFTRDLLLQVFSSSALVVCYKAKDVLRVLRQLYKREFTWKQVQGCQIHDPQLSGWLLDPTDPATCFQDLLYKHCRNPCTTPALGTKKVTQIITGLCSLYRLNIKLCEKLKNQGLWQLYSDMELKMLPVLAAMEVCQIHVDKEALKRTSDLLGTKMKQLEQEAHKAAGQMFLLTSSTQLRTVLFERLCLHEHCENKKLPKTINKQQSTSEAALLQLQDLHPLPKIILEYRQIHKIKSTFVDGILSCMMTKNYISSTWHQTSVVTGRVSATHPNFQALPRQPLQVTRKQFIAEKEDEVVTVHPRAMFVPKEGWTFLSADFCQVELRLLAHLSSDPELLRVFTSPEADVFNMLASQWKGVSVKEVSSEDREHAKRIVYSVVYGAGLERLSGILGVSTEQARRFQDSFLQTYMEVQKFIQKTVAECQQKGYVLSIMGRRRTLHNINSPDWSVRMQAERQAVNFVVQGSAADLCKMAMIRIFNLLSTSSSVSARLVAQLHDELLYEVEDSQIQQFAAVVKSTMESLEHIDQQNIHLKVPLKVAVSSGKSWGSMSELNV